MRKRKDVMLATSFSEKRFNQWPKPVIAQPKIEGDRCRMVISRFGSVTLYSSSSRVITSMLHLNEIMPHSLSEVELDGELYKHGMPHEEIRSMVSRTVELHPDYEEIEYHVFDLIYENETSQHARLGNLKRMFSSITSESPLKLVPSREVYTLEEVEEYLNSCIEEGYEGIILRHPYAPYKRSAPGHATCIMKLKPRLEGLFAVVGYEEEYTIQGKPKNALGSLVLEMWDTERIFKVGTGFTRRQREEYWRDQDELLGMCAKIRYQSLTEDRGVPKMSSFKDLIVFP